MPGAAAGGGWFLRRAFFVALDLRYTHRVFRAVAHSQNRLGDWQKRIYQIAQDFRLDSRRNNRRIVHYVTVIATQKLDDKDKQVGIFFDRNRLSWCSPRERNCRVWKSCVFQGLSAR